MKNQSTLKLLAAVFTLFATAISAAADTPSAIKASSTPDTAQTQISGSVITPDGKSAGNVAVMIDLYNFRKGVLASSQTATTDGHGAFTFQLPTKDAGNGIFPEFFAETPNGFGVSGRWNNSSVTITMEPLTSVRIHFVGIDGKPVPNLSVVPLDLYSPQQVTRAVLGKSLTPQWAQSTDASGTITLTGLPQGCSFRLDVGGAQYAPLDNYGQVSLANTAVTPDVTFNLSPVCSIAGTVTLPTTKAPAANVHIDANSLLGNLQRRTTVTDANGHYSFPRLAAGSYSIEVDDSTDPGQIFTAPAREIILSSTSGSVTADIPLVRAGRIVGTVRDKSTGKPLAGIMVCVNSPAHPSNMGGGDNVETGPDGRFQFRVPGGEQDLMALDRNNTSNIVRQSFDIDDGGVHYLDISMQSPEVMAPVSGIVLGPDNKPVAGAEIVVGTQDFLGRTITTDSAGRFTYGSPGLPAKTLIYARSGDLYTPGGTATGGSGDMVLRLAAGNSVSFKGQVKDETGRPIANAVVNLIRSIPVVGIGTYSLTGTTDADGRYNLGPDYSGFNYSVNATAPGYASGQSTQVPGSAGKIIELSTVTIAKADSFIGGTIVDPSGNPVAGAVVRLMTDQTKQVTTDSTGRFHFDGVPRNMTIIEVTAPENRFASIQESSGTDADVIKVENMAEEMAESVKFEAKINADKTNHGDGTDAYKLLNAAESQAAASGKQVLLVFHASWCGPCFMLHTFLEDPKVKPVIDAHFVVQDLDIWEHGKNSWENPGGTAIYKKYGGPNSVPYFVVLDKSGKKLGSSIYQGDNMGMPSDPAKTAFFLNTLKFAAPTISTADEVTLRDGLKRTAASF